MMTGRNVKAVRLSLGIALERVLDDILFGCGIGFEKKSQMVLLL